MRPRPRIVILDGHTLNPGDLSWNKVKAQGRTEVYEQTEPHQLLERAREAEILLVNKVIIDRPAIDQLPKLRCICVTATGYNNIDLAAARERGIPVCNVDGYGTAAVAQHVFALLLRLTNQVEPHNQSVRQGDWSKQSHFSYTLSPLVELAGKTLGIYGFGRIGQKAGEIARAFGMDIIAVHKHPRRDARPWVRFVELDELFSASDVLTLHAPLNEENRGLVDANRLRQMKPAAFLINTARGGFIVENDLREALLNQVIAGAALDVLQQEPPPADHPLFAVPNCILTPHNAWASREARERLLEGAVANICAFRKGQPQNVVN